MAKHQFLESLRADNRSSPIGMHWENFRMHLVRSAIKDAQYKLPNPLFLGGDIASYADKYRRLSEQLDWAETHGCLDEALVYLAKLPSNAWTTSDGSDWDQKHPWVRGER